MFNQTTMPGSRTAVLNGVVRNKPQGDACSLELSFVTKRIYDEKDIATFKSKSEAYKNLIGYVDLLAEKVRGTGNKTLNSKYKLKNSTFVKCECLLNKLEELCDQTELKDKGTTSLRFGYVSFRDWFDVMKQECRRFVAHDLVPSDDAKQYQEEMIAYLVESFGNRMRIDYGTGHELNFLIFTMGLSLLKDSTTGYSEIASCVNVDTLKSFVDMHGWDVLSLFLHKYLRLCRKVQKKFRLEPAGSRGVYNMDDFQFLPFLFGCAQLIAIRYIPSSNFYEFDQVDMFKNDFIFFEAVDFILESKKGPFNEHSYTLWNLSSMGSWDNIYRRIRSKYIDDVLGPFPIVQHLVFGKHILLWTK